MSCGGCIERQEAIKRIIDARKRGDMETVKREMIFITASSAQDLLTKLGLRLGDPKR